MINITLPDGSIRQFENPISSLDVAKSISEGLARNVLAAKVNDEILDANRLITSDSTLHYLHGMIKKESQPCGTHLLT
jgi:threonyl-tRNA synthetase